MLWQDYGALLRTHRENNADITIATHSVGWKQASLRGITRVDPDGDHPLPALKWKYRKIPSELQNDSQYLALSIE